MASNPWQPGTSFASDFAIVSTLREHATGDLYVAEQRSSQTRRVLQIMPSELANLPGLSQRIEPLARMVDGIPSEHVAQVVGAGLDTASGRPWIAMDLPEGEDLVRWRERNPAPSPDQVRAVIEQVGHALVAAHGVGITHGDVAPHNLFITRPLHAGAPFTLKVLGFGLIPLLREVPSLGLSLAPWLAPEQSEPGTPPTPASDLWTFGLLVFWLLTGKSYWRTASQPSVTHAALLQEVLEEPIVSASMRARELGCEGRLPDGFDPWFARCVAREPGARHAGMQEALSSFFALLRPGIGASAGPSFGDSPAGVPPWAGGDAPPGSPFDAVGGFGSAQAVGNPPGAFGAPGSLGSARDSPQRPFGTPSGQAPRALGSPPPGATPAWGPGSPSPQHTNGIATALIASFVAISVVGFLGLIGAGVYLGYRSASPSPAPMPVAVAAAPGQGPVPVDGDDAIWGSEQALVTVVVFSDYECPYCARLDKTLEQVKGHYGKQDLRVVWKHFPLSFHPNAGPAALAGATVRELGGQDAYWAFHHRAFNQREHLDDTHFEKWAGESGVDPPVFTHAYKAAKFQYRVDDDIALGKRVGVRGTPTTFINGVYVSGAQPLSKIETIVDDQLREARARLSSGIRRDRLYAELCNKNFEDPSARIKPPKKEKKKVDESIVWRVPVGDSPVRGSRDALVTIVLFSDYQCPFCKRLEGTLDQVREKYGRDVRIVWKDRPLPFHKHALSAAHFAREARKQKGDAAYWQAHDLLFQNASRLSDDDLSGYASLLGLDVRQVERAVRSKRHRRTIEVDTDLADALGARGTPTCFINGRQLRGAQPLEKFEKMIDTELRKARTRVAGGTPRAAVYDEIMKGARTPDAADEEAPERTVVDAPTDRNPWRGARDAKVVIQVFADFQCPFSARETAVFDRVIEAYPGKVRIVWRHFPLSFHKDAMLAAEASVEVHRQLGNKGFWAFHDLLMKNQKALARADLERYAEQVGARLPALREALDDGRHRSFVRGEIEAAKRAGVKGTPTCVINDRVIRGAQPFSKFRRVIDAL